MLGHTLFAIALAVSTANAQESEVIVPENKTQCIAQMVQWCDGMKYPQQGVGMSMLSVNYQEPTQSFRVLCFSDSDGTNCTRNGQPWFACSAENQLTYLGKILKADVSEEEVDSDICKTADRAFNELFVQNLSYDTITVEKEVQKGLETFFAELAAMKEEIEILKKLSPFFGDGLGDATLFESANATNATTEGSNQIEKE